MNIQPDTRPTDESSEASRVAVPAGEMPRLRFDRNELAGSFGDIGTALPLIIGIPLTTGADSASVFILFG